MLTRLRLPSISLMIIVALGLMLTAFTCSNFLTGGGWISYIFAFILIGILGAFCVYYGIRGILAAGRVPRDDGGEE